MDSAEGDANVYEKPRWFTPLRLLAIFCLTNLVVYLDRGQLMQQIRNYCTGE